MRQIALFILFLTLTSPILAQKQINDQFNTWITYSGNHKFTEKWDVHTLYSMRRHDFVADWQQSLLRVGVGYKLTKKIKTQIGYDWIRTFPYGAQPISHVTDEHRAWVHLNTKFQEKRFSFLQRLRFENRVIEQFDANLNKSGFVLKYRLRYKFGLVVPLNHSQLEDKTLFMNFNNEIFMNVINSTKYFDQNWFYTGFGWRFNKSISVKIGYLNQFFPKTDGIRIENNHTLKLDYIHSFDFSRKTQ